MDNLREKLITMIQEAVGGCARHWAELIADHLIANGVTFVTDNNVGNKWIPASEPPEVYRDKYRQLIPFLVCTAGQEYPFKTFYDGKKWGARGQDVSVTHWMPLPEPPKGE